MAAISYAHVVREKLEFWAPVAQSLGMSTEFVAAVKEMDERLRSDPETWGEPVKDYLGMRLRVYHRYGRILTVKYAVHIDGTPVFVQNVFLTPGTELYNVAE